MNQQANKQTIANSSFSLSAMNIKIKIKKHTKQKTNNIEKRFVSEKISLFDVPRLADVNSLFL